MESVILFFLFCVIIGSLGYGLWQRRPPSPSAKKQMYKDLEHRAKEGDKEAMYQMASLFYEEKDERYYPQIFKWASILAAQEKDPAVWGFFGVFFYFWFFWFLNSVFGGFLVVWGGFFCLLGCFGFCFFFYRIK